jgi:hypothetical protein
MTRRRNAIIALLAGAATLIAAASAAAAPERTDSFDEPVYLVKGYAPGDDRPRCDSRWRSAISAMHRRGWIGQLVRVGFYAWDTPDTGCDVNLTQGHAPGSRNTSIRDLGKSLAWNIYNVYSSKGKSIDLVGHSMGGLIIRAALAGYQRREPGWPGRGGEELYVEDVVTLGTPHAGTPFFVNAACSALSTRQCEEMKPGSRFMSWLAKTPNPQAAGGTDWTLIGSSSDEVAPPETATPRSMGAHHRVAYPLAEALSHSKLRSTTRGRFRMHYQNHGDPKVHFRADGASPIKATQHSLYWATRW